MATGAAKRYTEAVFSIAREQGTFEQWQRDLDTLAQLMTEPGVRAVLESPNVDESRKEQLIASILTEAQPEATNLARLLLQRGRIGLVGEMAEVFREAALAELGIVVADVTTAQPLDKAGEALVRQRLTDLIGKQVEIRTHVDPEIIGGIVAKVGDQLLDGSVASQLRRLRDRMSAPV